MAKRKIIIPLSSGQPVASPARTSAVSRPETEWQVWLDKFLSILVMAEELLAVAEPVLSAWTEMKNQRRGGKKR
ncbi:MAG: hypothetical protein ACOY3H_04255 [Bacillota bacterium]